VGRIKTCPRCGWSSIRPSTRRGVLDYVLAFALIEPLRCRRCRLRFYRFSKQSLAVEPAVAAEPVKVNAAPGHSILILEGDPSIRRLLRRILVREGYWVFELSSESELIAQLQTHTVDLLLGELSEALLTSLRKSHPYLKTIAIPDIPQPFHAETLVDLIRTALSDS
jgi:PleD family two-component response regulator